MNCLINPNQGYPHGVPAGCSPTNTGWNNPPAITARRDMGIRINTQTNPNTPAPPLTPPIVSKPPVIPGSGSENETGTNFLTASSGILGMDNLTLLLVGAALIAVIYFIKKK